MKIVKFFTHDSAGKPSITRSAFALGFLIVNLKLIFSGVELAGIKLAAFSGTEYAAALTALGAVYVMRRASFVKDDPEKKD